MTAIRVAQAVRMATAHIAQAAIGSEARDQSEGSRTRGYGQIANESIEASTMIANENARPPIRCDEHVQRRGGTPSVSHIRK